ncbi:MAG: hypothetical protein IPH80_38510 [Myxococcales bacterium]|nr:hypothetical protein [Myxococcales bacterium]
MVTEVAVSPDGRWLASSSADRTDRVTTARRRAPGYRSTSSSPGAGGDPDGEAV